MANHHFQLHTSWPGGRNNVGTIETRGLRTSISIPTEMDGPGIGTNPDEMLLGAAATCYIISLGAMIERSNISVHSMEMNSEGIVEVDEKGVFTYKKIIHKPTVVLGTNSTSKEQAKVEMLCKKAESSCMITRAVQGNVDISLEATVSIFA